MHKPADVRNIITDQFKGSILRLSPRDLVRRVRTQRPDLPSARIHSAIKHLVQQGILIYSHRCATTQIELNFQRYIEVTPSLALCPETACQDPLPSKEIQIIRLGCGDAFGLGDHPTTCLALLGIEMALKGLPAGFQKTELHALDIGTGSGILALAAARLGAGQVCAVDHDAVARHEAGANVALNGLAAVIQVCATSLEEMQAREYVLIMANLRPPTLRALFGQMARISRAPSMWVLSGFRSEEGTSLSDYLEKKGASISWHQKERGWAAMVVELNNQALRGIWGGV